MTVEIKRKVSVILAAMVAAVFGLVAFVAPVAQAAEGNIPDSPYTLVVHKHKQNTLGTAGTGEELTGEAKPADPLQGVNFTIAKVEGLDLAKFKDYDPNRDTLVLNADRKAVLTINGEVAGTFDVAAAGTPVETDFDGKATFTVQERGVYLVEEGADAGENNIVKKAAPFFVVLPMPINGVWSATVHAYPKNSVTKVDKTVDDSAAFTDGQVVTWLVTSEIPERTAEGEKFGGYAVEDTFDNRLEFSNDLEWNRANDAPGKFKSGTGIKVWIEKGDQVTELKEGTDYRVITEGQKVTVDFTKESAENNPGTMTNVLDDNRGGVLHVVFPTKVKEPGENGMIPNTAIVYNADPKDENTPKNPTPEPKTPWGEIHLQKKDAENGKLLDGAKFTIYRMPSADEEFKKDTAIKVKDIEIKDGDVKQTLKVGTYWLVETTAPTGYVLNETPIKVEVKAGKVTEANPQLKEITNTKEEIPDLPLTGASGQLLMMVGGLAIVLMGAGVGLVAYKRNRA